MQRNGFGTASVARVVIDEPHRVARAAARTLAVRAELGEAGRTPVDQLLLAVRERDGDRATVDRAVLRRMTAAATKQRFELDADRIRARCRPDT